MSNVDTDEKIFFVAAMRLHPEIDPEIGLLSKFNIKFSP